MDKSVLKAHAETAANLAVARVPMFSTILSAAGARALLHEMHFDTVDAAPLSQPQAPVVRHNARLRLLGCTGSADAAGTSGRSGRERSTASDVDRGGLHRGSKCTREDCCNCKHEDFVHWMSLLARRREF